MSYHSNPILRPLPRLGARSVGALPPMIQGPTLDTRVLIVNRQFGAAAGSLFRACMTDSIGPQDMDACYNVAEKQLPTLQGDQLSFYNSCMAQKSADVPVVLQHNACFSQAQQLQAGGGGGAPTPSVPYAPPPVTSTASDGGLLSNKWVWLGGAVALGGLAWVLLKKPAPAHA